MLLFKDPLYLVNYLYAALVAVALYDRPRQIPTSLPSMNDCSAADSMHHLRRCLRLWASGLKILLW
jgi:hypothetical protein